MILLLIHGTILCVGFPIENGIGKNMLYINGYLNVTGIDDTYRECKKTIIDDIILITEYPEEEVFIKKQGECVMRATRMVEASRMQGRYSIPML